MSDAFARRWAGLRFVEPATERAYQDWAILEAAPFIRMGMVGSLLSWTVALAGTWSAAPRIATEMSYGLSVVIPIIVLTLALTWAPKLYRGLFLMTALANTGAGLVATIPTFMSGREYTAVGLAGVVVVGYFAFTIFRLPLLWALAAVTPYFGYFAVSTFTAPVELVSPEYRVLLVTVLTVAASSGSLGCAVLELASRRAFMQEKLIAQQSETIERLLKQEISHQVAERSRALSETLAKVEVALPAARLEPGHPFDSRYVVVRELGKGGMGAVYEVERVTDNQRFALKVITGNVTGSQAARFAREAEIGARIRHPNLVPIVDVGVSARGAPFLVMELVEGKSLEDHRARFGDVSWGVPLLRQIADGLIALHQGGVVHRDLKPANVLISREAARISDFGISRYGELSSGDVDPMADTAGPSEGQRGQPLTRTGALMGTPMYMAPEGARGGRAVDKPADVYAFGLIAYELLNNRFPFSAPPVLEAMAGRALAKPHAFDHPLAAIVLACLAEDPAARPEIDAVRAGL